MTNTSKSAKLELVQAKPKIRLSPFCKGVEVSIVKWYEDPKNAEFFRRCPPICDWMSLGGIEAIFGTLWVAYEEDRPVGLVGLFNKDVYSRTCELGMLIDGATDQKDAAKQLMDAFADYAFNYLNLHKIYIKIMPWRDKLAKRMEGQGFSKECDLRDSCYFKGEYHSEMLYSCLKLEYKWHS